MTERYLGIDQGTQSSRAILFNQQGEIEASAQLAVSLLHDGERCEQDGNEILDSLTTVITSVIEQIGADPDDAVEITAAGLATQRSSVIAWDAKSGQPLSPLLSWSDRRGEAFIASIRHQESLVRSHTGLPLTAYYGGSKIRWLLMQNRAVKQARQQQRLCIGPLASFLLFNLLQDSPYVVDHANALRTQLFNLDDLQWDAELLDLYAVPQHLLPEVKPTQTFYGRIKAGNIPLMAVNGDQTAALRTALSASECGALVNVGSGAFILSSTGNRPMRSGNLLTGLFHSSSEQREYLLEGTVNGAGSALQWLGHKMPSRGGCPRIEDLLRKRPFGQISRPLSLNSAAIRLKCTKNLTQNGVPSLRPLFSDSLLESVDLEHAFSKPFSDTIFINGIGGLGSPFWKSLNSGFWSISRECMIEDMQTIDDNLQGLVAESILFLIQANIDAMLQQGRGFQQLTITGGIARADSFCQRLANLSGMEVVRPHIVEATARGIASEAAGEYGQWSNSIPDKFYPQHDVLLNKRYRTFLTLI